MLIALIATGTLTVSAEDEALDADRVAFFESKIRPVLVRHCYSCHSADGKSVKGNLLLDSAAGIAAGGDSGPAVTAGEPEDSLLISALKHESFEMPPDRRLSDQIIADFETWIRDGAIDPRKGGRTIQRSEIDLEKGRTFWSFQPITQPSVPDVGTQWAQTEIDRFIAAGHMSAGVKPALDADADQVLRRLSIVLTGLPPSVERIFQFRAEWQADPDRAISAEADRLLASRQFGERFGRHWLDVTRFAESSGGGRSLMFPHAWRFRDYVIASFNDDKPIDQLMWEHVAGDLLPYTTARESDEQVTGSGYLVLGPTNYEQQDKELLRMDVIDEQIDSLGRTFLGLTLGCARCHDHKFDPIPMTDYYGLAGIFRSTETLTPGNVSGYVLTDLKTNADRDAFEKWSHRDSQIRQQIAEIRDRVAPNSPTLLASGELTGVVVDDRNAEYSGEWVESTSVKAYVDAGYRHNSGNAAEGGVTFRTQLAPGRYHVRFAYSASSNRSSRVPVTVSTADGEVTVVLNQQKTPAGDGVFATLGEFTFDDDAPAAVFVDAPHAGAGVVVVDAVQFLSLSDTADVSRQRKADSSEDPAAAKQTMRKLRQRLSELEEQLKQHGKQKPETPQAMSVRDLDSSADWHVHLRGSAHHLGPLTPRTALSVTMPLDADGKPIPLNINSGSGRLQLADWLTAEANPLTARVFVNRIWTAVIGEGLVRTPDNFGATGQLPTHPELLDHLAWNFIHRDQWSVKKLVRSIVVSRVFRIRSNGGAHPQDDPGNRLLTRAFRRHLDVEVLRDTMLLTSGQLDFSVQGGLTIRKLTQYDNGYDHDSLTPPVRSVYVPLLRNSILPMFDVFDMANANLVTGRRNVSTLPAQGLFLQNSSFVMAQAKLSAERLLKESTTADDRIDHLWLVTLGRLPEAEERSVVLSYVNDQPEDINRWAAVVQSVFSSLDFRYME
ncbi:MAG: DUF1553 domain-containing protein [Planctomycetaceae bacterium]